MGKAAMNSHQARTVAIINASLIAAGLPTYSAVVATIDALLKERDLNRSVALTHLRLMQTQWRSMAPMSLALEIDASIAAVGANPAPDSPEGQLLAGAYAIVNAVKDERTGETK